MSSVTLRDLDPELVQIASQKARDAGTDLTAVLRAYLLAYVTDRTGQQTGPVLIYPTRILRVLPITDVR